MDSFGPKNAPSTVMGEVSRGDVLGVPTEWLQLTVELDLNVDATMSLLFINGDTLNSVTIQAASMSLRKVDC